MQQVFENLGPHDGAGSGPLILPRGDETGAAEVASRISRIWGSVSMLGAIMCQATAYWDCCIIGLIGGCNCLRDPFPARR